MEEHTKPPATRGGNRPGAGRPKERETPLVPVTVKLEPAQKAKLQRLGGAPWVRQQIDQAKE